jgi:DNA-binding MarR family transcriptional regulator
MSDIDAVLHAMPRILFACRVRRVRDPRSGKGVSAHRVGILSHLDEEDPTMVGELAEHLGVTASTMSLTLKRLEEVGYIRRDRDPSDRRVTNVRLTEAGARVRNAQTLLDPERVARTLTTLGPAQRADAVRGLRLLADAADAFVRAGHEAVTAQLEGEVL